MKLLQYLLLSTVCISFSYIAFRLIIKTSTKFRIQRLFIILTLFLSLLLPLSGFRIVIGEFPEVNMNPGSDNEKITTLQTMQPFLLSDNGTRHAYYKIIYLVYFAVTFFLLFSIILQLLKTYRLYRKSQRSRYNNIIIVTNPEIKSPFSLFNFVFIPDNLTDKEERSSIITHESIHSSQLHTIDNILFELTTAIMWFNPLVWLMKKSLYLIHEYLADEGTLDNGIDRLKYKSHLLNQATEERLISIPSGFNNKLLKERMIMMTENKNKQLKKGKILTIVPISAILFASVGILNGLFPENATGAGYNSNMPDFQNKAQVQAPAQVIKQDTLKKKSIQIREASSRNTPGTNSIKIVGYGGTSLPDSIIYVVDGVQVKNFEEVNPETIESVNVLKEDNLIIIRTKGYKIEQTDINTVEKAESDLPDNVLFIIDGKPAGKTVFEKIDPDLIDLIDVIKGKEEIKKYTKKDYDGVIIVKTKSVK